MTSESDAAARADADAEASELAWETVAEPAADSDDALDGNAEARTLDDCAAPRDSPHPGKAKAAIPKADIPTRFINDLRVNIMQFFLSAATFSETNIYAKQRRSFPTSPACFTRTPTL